MREKAAVYARYSSHSQTEQSIEGQLAAAQKYAEEHDYMIVKTYCDRAKTGTNDNREAFQQMLKDCSKGVFSVIVVWKVDRFGRNREEITFNKYKAKKHGVRIEYIAENISSGPEGVILESVLEGMAEYYSLQLSQNIRRGLVESAKKHKVIGGPPTLGYRRSKEGTYEIDPETAPIIKEIFEKYVGGMTIFELVDYLNSKGYKTSRGKSFTKNSLPRILRNRRYIGVYEFTDQICEEDAIPAIIDKELFAKAQNINSSTRKPSHRWRYSEYLLTDKLFCGHCGAPMVGKSGYGRSGAKYNYYVCSNQLKHACSKRPVRKETVEELVLSKIEEILNQKTVFDTIVDLVWERYQKEDKEVTEARLIERDLENINRSIKNLVASVESGMPFELIKDRLEELKTDKEKKEESLINLRVIPRLTKDHIVFFLEQFRKFDLADEKCQKKLIDTFVNSIFLYDDKLIVGLNYGGEEETITLENINESVRIENAHLHFCQSMRTVGCVLLVEIWL